MNLVFYWFWRVDFRMLVVFTCVLWLDSVWIWVFRLSCFCLVSVGIMGLLYLLFLVIIVFAVILLCLGCLLLSLLCFGLVFSLISLLFLV